MNSHTAVLLVLLAYPPLVAQDGPDPLIELQQILEAPSPAKEARALEILTKALDEPRLGPNGELVINLGLHVLTQLGGSNDGAFLLEGARLARVLQRDTIKLAAFVGAEPGRRKALLFELLNRVDFPLGGAWRAPPLAKRQRVFPLLHAYFVALAWTHHRDHMITKALEHPLEHTINVTSAARLFPDGEPEGIGFGGGAGGSFGSPRGARIAPQYWAITRYELKVKDSARSPKDALDPKSFEFVPHQLRQVNEPDCTWPDIQRSWGRERSPRQDLATVLACHGVAGSNSALKTLDKATSFVTWTRRSKPSQLSSAGIQEQVDLWYELRGAIVDQRWLSSRDARKFKPDVQVEVIDNRTDKSNPLPKIRKWR